MLLTKPKLVATAAQQHSGVLPVLFIAARSRSVAKDVRAFAQATEERSRTPESSALLENVTTDYCNDFECTSSPAVASTVASVSQDLRRGCRYTTSLFAKDVKYTDGVRSFTGSDKYQRLRWIAKSIGKPNVVVNRMQMLDKGTAQIDWTLRGTFNGAQVDIGIKTVVTLNLLTGRILTHTDTWDMSKVSAPVAAMIKVSRIAWAAKQASMDATQGINKKVQESLSSFDGEDENSNYYPNPTDPTRFFQGNQDNGWNDAVQYATVAALLYLAFRAFSELEKLN